MTEQLVFDLPMRQVRGRDAFFVSDANAHAVQVLDHPENWPLGKMILLGPKSSGKTHLAQIWAEEHDAEMVQDIHNPPHAPAWVVEDVDHFTGNPTNETALFHLHNLAQEHQIPLLLTAQTPPQDWGMGLADLQSRMLGTATVTIAPPDDQLLQAVMIKQFADRQITPSPNVVSYVMGRMDRSFAAVSDIVNHLDRLSLSQGKNITRRLAAQVLETSKGIT